MGKQSRFSGIYLRQVKFSPFEQIPNGDLLSILAIIFRTKYKHNYRREKIFSSADGQCLNLDWLEDPTDTNETKIMLMLPGISGHRYQCSQAIAFNSISRIVLPSMQLVSLCRSFDRCSEERWMAGCDFFIPRNRLN